MQFSLGQFLDSFYNQDPVEWSGFQIAGSRSGLAPFVSGFGNFVHAKSNCAYNPSKGYHQTYEGNWLIVGESIAAKNIGLKFSGTVGSYSATSPGIIGPNAVALRGGYLQAGGTTIINGAGFTFLSRFLMGYGSGQSRFGITFGLRGSLLFSASTGISFSLPGGNHDNCTPTPQ